jgi:cold shock CspA family protein
MEKHKSGSLQTWIASRGFGFITVVTDGVPEKYYLHISKVESGKPFIDAIVKFNVAPEREGKFPSAINVDVLGAAK